MLEAPGQSSPAPTVVTPGNHDGVHLGHRALLDTAREQADAQGLRVLVLTFDPHPTSVIAPDRVPAVLTTLPRRKELLIELGADEVRVQRFDRAFAATTPQSFVEDFLVRQLGARAVVVGPDFRFGKGRSGDLSTLREIGSSYSLTVHRVEPVMCAGLPVSSTRIRRAVSEGHVGEAARLLSRVHEVEGTVVMGDQRGRTIGFPTANLECDAVLLPADGVYAAVAKVVGDEGVWPAVANFGVRPTFDAGRSVEVHLLDFEGDLYGARLRVGLVRRLRGERRFDGLAALKTQIGRDAEQGQVEIAAADSMLWRYL